MVCVLRIAQGIDTLFFKNLVTNEGVLYTLVDAAEEEACKEIILVYYHLLTAGEPLTGEELDTRIEQWMEQRFDTKIDFDIRKTLTNLAALRAPVDAHDGQPARVLSLLHIDESGRCHVLPLNDAKAVIDYIWDNVFDYTTSLI